MSDFENLESIAVQIKENRVKLHEIEDSLSSVNVQLHEIPLKRATESTFAKITGVGYDDKMADLQRMKEQSERTKADLKSSISKDIDTFISEFSSPNLIIPLESYPKIIDGKTVYKYRGDSQFKNVFEMLCEILGLSSPLVVKDVMLSPTEIVIAVKDEFEAKQKFISSLQEIQHTLLIKKK
ncbi:MAG: hypothetical protein OPY06_04110 [Nitrosopumilus sp.]|nr:hypothetical protein [Nitrosopumilus sp.]MDF2423401.1 hypothetical protein [Nitrosopumilus sp.]MDF2423729.1 hypothetical protein [Nitrosopumilus sp.]MDF2425558.1 hypothetical protein [Nitrosopumilus sp.]MDF2426778.1 hypothetical protein [Nitrosopumilus sp.]